MKKLLGMEQIRLLLDQKFDGVRLGMELYNAYGFPLIEIYIIKIGLGYLFEYPNKIFTIDEAKYVCSDTPIAQVTKKYGGIKIFLNGNSLANCSDDYLNFTLIHEIGHLFHDYYEDDYCSKKYWYEARADSFAIKELEITTPEFIFLRGEVAIEIYRKTGGLVLFEELRMMEIFDKSHEEFLKYVEEKKHSVG